MSLVDFAPFLSLAAFGLVITPASQIGSLRGRESLTAQIGIVGLFLALGSTIWLGWFTRVQTTPVVGQVISTDLFTYFFAGVLITVSLFVAVASLSFMKGDPNEAPYFGLLILSTLGMIVRRVPGPDTALCWMGTDEHSNLRSDRD